MLKTRFAWTTIAMALMLLALTPGTGEAHTPRYKSAGEDISSFERPKVVDDSAVSYAYYAELVPGKVDIYQVYATAGQALNPALLLPKMDELRTFTPTIAIIGPAITTTVASALVEGGTASIIPLSGLPIAPTNVSTNTGAIVIENGVDVQNRPTEFEPFTQTSYWKGQAYKTSYPQYAAYYIMVWDRLGRGGKYVLTVGEREEFGLFDLVKFPYTWAKLQLWFGNWLSLVISAIIVLFIAFLLLRLIQRRRKVTRVEAPGAPS